MAVKRAANVVALTLFRIIRAYSLKKQVKKMFFAIFLPFGLFKPYSTVSFSYIPVIDFVKSDRFVKCDRKNPENFWFLL